MWTHYYSATSLPEVFTLLGQHQGRARIVAGGTDILLELERGARPGIDTLIDITRIPGLDAITHSAGQLHLGPMTTHNQVVGHPLIRQYALPLAQACWEVGAPQIRNRATVAGNLITASPANDTITALMALEASVTLASTRGERTLPLAQFYTGYRQQAMQPDELLTGIHIPTLTESQAGVFLKLALRRAQAISVIDTAVVLTFAQAGDRHSPITQAAIAFGCVAPTIVRLPQVEAALGGKTLDNDTTLNELGRMAAQSLQPIDDVRGPAEYRIAMIEVYLKRALRALRDGQEAAHFPSDPTMLSGDAPAPLPQTVHHERDAAETIITTVNGQVYTAEGGAHKTLLRFLRENLHLIGTKEGCAEGECGACTVLLDGSAVMACMVPAPRAHGASIVTVEGLSDSEGHLHPIQQGFIEAGAVQCGFCTPGFLVAGAKLLDENPTATREQVEQSISGNLCRCTGYYKILEAFERAQAIQQKGT
jgi:carbon-monoxide dehydrogenase medium subunit